MNDPILKMQNITKEFPGVKALDNVNFIVEEGEIHALVGENGAGKSTLMKVLSGVHPYGSYDGDIIFESEVSEFHDINESENRGIVIIHQELALISEMTIAENIFLGNEQIGKRFIDWRKTNTKAEELLNRVGLQISVSNLIKNIGVGKQQLVEIAKALSKNVKLLILDEPTASLNDEESENLLELLIELKKQGITSIIISHKLNEVLEVSDNITVLRDGKTIETIKNKNITEERIIKGMVGRDLENLYPARQTEIGDITFEVSNWTVEDPQRANRNIIDDVNINVRRGEVVGVAGLMGAGRTELMMSIFGKSFGDYKTGTLTKNGKSIELDDVKSAIEAGIAYVSEDRKEYGLVLDDSIKHNVTLANLKSLQKNMTIDEYKETDVVKDQKKRLNIKAPSIEQDVVNLSGGNQQKVVLGKWLYTNPDILILDEPTRGIDIGAKNEIYKIINELVEEGKSIILVSSELPELLGLADRIYTLSEGKITGELNKEDATQEKLMAQMTQDGSGKSGKN